jgi:dihydrofolate reductase
LKIIIIVAVARNGIIGRATGEMPWHVKQDFQHFKKTTMGFPIIMGRKSFESLGKPLIGRENIVITRNKELNYEFENVRIFHSLDDALDYCKSQKSEKAFITGGGEIYRQSILFADEMIISHMKFDAVGEVSFPKINNSEWEVSSKEDREEFEIVNYIRTN